MSNQKQKQNDHTLPDHRRIVRIRSIVDLVVLENIGDVNVLLHHNPTMQGLRVLQIQEVELEVAVVAVVLIQIPAFHLVA